MGRIRVPLFLALALFAFFLATFDLWTGRAVVPWDAHDFFTPSYVTLADFVRSGHLMLWNPWMAGGLPDYVEPQVGAFSPLALVVGLVCGGTLAGFRIYFFAVWTMSGVGVFLLGWRFRVPAWGSALVAFNWLFSGFLLGHAQHVSWMYSMGCLPFTVLLLDQAIQRGSWKRFAAAGAIWGVSMLGGYPGIVFNSALVLGGWALGRTLFTPKGWAWSDRPAGRRAGLAGVGLSLVAAVGIAVMAPNLFGMLVEAVGVTSRSAAITRDAAINNNPLGLWCLSSLATPFLATLPPAKLWPRTDLSMASVYIGALTLTFAAAALARRKLNRWGLAAGAIFLLLVSLGPITPLRGWLYDVVPFTRYFQHPAMYTGPAMFLIAVLGLLGLRDLDGAETKRYVPLLIAAVLSVGALATLYWVGSRAGVRPPSRATLQLVLAWAGTTSGIAIWAMLPSRPRIGKVLFAAVLMLSTFLDGYLADKMLITHADRRPGVVASEDTVMRRHRSGLDLASMSGANRGERVQPGLGVPGLSAWASVLKTPVWSGYTTLRNPEQEAMARQPPTQRLAFGNTKAWFSAAAVQAPPTAALFTAFMNRSASAGVPPLAIHEPDDFRRIRSPGADDLSAMGNAPPLAPLTATLLRYSPTVLELTVEAPSEGWLLVNDRWAPGWTAEVNGRPAKVYPADFVFRAVSVRQGSNRVLFRYRPSTLLPALLLCWGILFAVALLQFDRQQVMKRIKLISGWRNNPRTRNEPR